MEVLKFIYIYIGIFVFDNYNKENYTIGIIIKSHGAMATLVQMWPHPGHPWCYWQWWVCLDRTYFTETENWKLKTL